MANAIVKEPDAAEAVNLAIIQGDLSRLSPDERRSYYLKTCESLGLNPLTKPFEYLRLNNKEILYATKSCTEQLRTLRRVSLQLGAGRVVEGVYVIEATATVPGGRTDAATGAVAIEGLKGEARANALMKAETKAKRRVTLSICGLGMLDESEVETLPGAQVMHYATSPSTKAEEPAAPRAELPAAVRFDPTWDASKQQAPPSNGEDLAGDFTRQLLEAKGRANLLEWRRCTDAIARAVRAGKLTPIEADALRNLAASTKAAIVSAEDVARKAEEAEYEASYGNDEPSGGPL